jgi:hypothetical protein
MIKLNSLAMLGVASLLLAPAVSHAQVKKSGAGYLLRMKYKAGKTLKYTVTSTITGMPAEANPTGAAGPMKLVGPLTESIKTLTGKNANVDMSLGPFLLNGASVGQAQTQSFQVDELGNVVGQGKGFGVRFPKDAVKVGGTWTASMSLPGSMGAQSNSKTTFTFNGMKTVGKQKLADISYVVQPMTGVKSGNGHAYLSPVDGSLVSMKLTMTLQNPQGTGSDITISTEVQTAK